MAPHELSARLKFLSDSSLLLAATAPETSRYLISKRDALVEDNNIDSSYLKMHQSCPACGTLVILGWESSLRIESQRTEQRPGKHNNTVTNRPRTAIFFCKVCGAQTRQVLDAHSKPKHKIPSVGSKPQLIAENQIKHPSASSKGSLSSKKRKKSKSSNLEALLNKSKLAKPSPVQLNLMDFMDKA